MKIAVLVDQMEVNVSKKIGPHTMMILLHTLNLSLLFVCPPQKLILHLFTIWSGWSIHTTLIIICRLLSVDLNSTKQ